jgi:prepilin-type N-terminal cleavage/methylation domain-containing protein
MKRAGFTMIELIFVIVILGILGAVAIPKLSGIKDDAQLANANENICVNLKGSILAYSVRHQGSIKDLNLSKYIDLSSAGWTGSDGNTISGTTSVINTANKLIPSNAASGTTISPFISIPKNSVYVYFLDGNETNSETYGCFIGNSGSYTKSATELRTLLSSGSNYL